MTLCLADYTWVGAPRGFCFVFRTKGRGICWKVGFFLRIYAEFFIARSLFMKNEGHLNHVGEKLSLNLFWSISQATFFLAEIPGII